MDWNRNGAFHCWRDIYGVNAMEHEETRYEEREESYESKELSPETAKQIAIEKGKWSCRGN